MNQAHINALVDDIRDCAKRTHELGFFQRAEALNQIAIDIAQMSNRQPTPSNPNRVVRETASQCFRAARELLKDIDR